MSQNVFIKLTKVGPSIGPFDVFDNDENLVAEDVPRKALIKGVGYFVNDGVSHIKIVSKGACTIEKVVPLTTAFASDLFTAPTTISVTGCLWKHMTNLSVYNTYYGVVKPYIIEYPFSHDYFDEVVRNVKDYSKVYKYITSSGKSPSLLDRKNVDNEWFNKSVIYNDQQSTGILELVPKPKNNLSEYLTYPRYKSDSKVITYAKSDSFYIYNTFWSIVKDLDKPLFTKSCESQSYDKEVNNSNMDYGLKSFTKAPIRGKEIKVRHILDNKGDIHIISRIIFVPTQISHK